jgi:hypothetical protein
MLQSKDKNEILHYVQNDSFEKEVSFRGRTRGLGVSPTLEIPFRYGILLDNTYHGRANVWGTIRGFGYCFPLSRGIAGG